MRSSIRVILSYQNRWTASLYGIDAFDQPGVEAGKIAAFALMGRKGFEDKAKEIKTRLKGKAEFVV